MKKVLVAFGDSWTFGSELDVPQQDCWAHQLAQQIDAEHVNLGTPASSIGHLAVQLFDFVQQEQYTDYKKIFMVGLSARSRYLSFDNQLKEFVNITTEAVYRTRDIQPTGQSPKHIDKLLDLKYQTYARVDDEYYANFITAQTVMLFQNYARLNNIDCVFFSYFDYPDLSAYRSVLDLDKLYPETITRTLTGMEYTIPDIRSNKYFETRLWHPNSLGHQQIAKILKTFYESKYT
jgi:hypothetical protein